MSYCTMCGSPLPESHKHKTCSMCFGDIDYGTDGYYRQWAEEREKDSQREREREQEQYETRTN